MVISSPAWYHFFALAISLAFHFPPTTIIHTHTILYGLDILNKLPYERHERKFSYGLRVKHTQLSPPPPYHRIFLSQGPFFGFGFWKEEHKDEILIRFDYRIVIRHSNTFSLHSFTQSTYRMNSQSIHWFTECVGFLGHLKAVNLDQINFSYPTWTLFFFFFSFTSAHIFAIYSLILRRQEYLLVIPPSSVRQSLSDT